MRPTRPIRQHPPNVLLPLRPRIKRSVLCCRRLLEYAQLCGPVDRVAIVLPGFVFDRASELPLRDNDGIVPLFPQFVVNILRGSAFRTGRE